MTDYEITDAMIHMGGNFVHKLALAYRAADAVNQAKLRDTFAEYWTEYRRLAQLKAEKSAAGL